MNPAGCWQGAAGLAAALAAAAAWNALPPAADPDRLSRLGSPGSRAARTRAPAPQDDPRARPRAVRRSPRTVHGGSPGDHQDRVPVSIVLEMVAAVLDCGASPSRAVATVADCLRDTPGPLPEALRRLARQVADGPGAEDLPDAPAALEPLLESLDLALRAGIGPAPLVRCAARDHRRRRAEAGILAARRLGVTVLLPTGLCLLPAFVLLTVVPLVLALLGNGS